MLSEPEGNAISSSIEPDLAGKPIVYQLRVKGHLGADWTDWFEGLSISLEDTGHTLLTGPVVDQAALYGMLKKIRDLGLLLISVNCLDTSSAMALRRDQEDEGNDQP